LATTLDFTTFSPCSYFKGAAPFFTASMFWYSCVLPTQIWLSCKRSCSSVQNVQSQCEILRGGQEMADCKILSGGQEMAVMR